MFGVLVGKLYDIIPLEENGEALNSDVIRGLDELNSSLRGILLRLPFNVRTNSRQVFRKRAAFKSCLIGLKVRRAQLRGSIFA